MPYIGLIAWIIFIGIATFGNWFFLIIGGYLLAVAIIGAIIAFVSDTTRNKNDDQGKNEIK